jgi:hypothetical protein
MLKLNLSAILAASVIGAFAQAQALVPARNYNMESHSAVVLPFNNNNMIMQQLMPPADVGLANNTVINSVSFIREGNFEGNYPAFTMDRVEVRLENVTTLSLASTVGNNTHWTGGVVPAPRNVTSPLTAPAFSAPNATGPANNYVTFNLSPPLTYNNTQNLLLEIRNVATSMTDSSPPAPGNITDRSLTTSFGAIRGTGCPNNLGQVPGFGTFTTVPNIYAIGNTTTGQITNLSTTVLLWAYWFGLQYQTVLGAPPGLQANLFFPGVGAACRFWVDPFLIITGGGTTFPQIFSVFIPNDTSILGSPLGTQAVFIDSNAPGSLTMGPGLYAYVKTPTPNNACQLVLRVGAGDFSSPAADALPLNSIPVQAYAVTVRLN